MTGPWATLIPLAIVTAVLPIQVMVTILLLRSPGGLTKAGAWVLGMSIVRVVQYALFGVVLERAMGPREPGPSPVEGAFLLIVAVLLLVSAVRKLASQPDEDAPPPAWMARLDGVSAGVAFVMGAGLVALSPKLWAFTLAAIGAISETQPEPVAGWLTFLVWVVLAQAIHVAALLASVVAPRAAGESLARLGIALERHSRPLMIGLCLILGAWFLLKALVAFGFGSAA